MSALLVLSTAAQADKYYLTDDGTWHTDPTAATAYADRYDAAADCLRLSDAGTRQSGQRLYIRESTGPDWVPKWLDGPPI